MLRVLLAAHIPLVGSPNPPRSKRVHMFFQKYSQKLCLAVTFTQTSKQKPNKHLQHVLFEVRSSAGHHTLYIICKGQLLFFDIHSASGHNTSFASVVTMLITVSFDHIKTFNSGSVVYGIPSLSFHLLTLNEQGVLKWIQRGPLVML